MKEVILMKGFVATFVAFSFVFALVSIGFAADMKVEGKVEKMEGGFVTIKDAQGKMHKLHTNESTKMMGGGQARRRRRGNGDR